MVESDAELVQSALEGNMAAFETLVRRYERSVRSIAWAYLADSHASEDVTQETFVTAFRSMASLQQQHRFGPWLMQIARRTAGRSAERRKRVPLAVPMDEVSSRQTPATSLRSQQLLDAIERLPEHERLVITLRFFDGHSSEEIGLITGRPVGTITKQLSRAYQRLRQWLAALED